VPDLRDLRKNAKAPLAPLVVSLDEEFQWGFHGMLIAFESDSNMISSAFIVV
jgi:hypothetical protein